MRVKVSFDTVLTLHGNCSAGSRREKIEKRLDKAQKLAENRKFVELSVHPCLVRHFMCCCVDVLLPLMMQFDTFVEMMTIQQTGSISLEEAKLQMNNLFLDKLMEHGVRVHLLCSGLNKR
jgi:hypothetical protein